MNKVAKFKYACLCMVMITFFACQQPGGDVTGSEYMADMGHSLAYEANVYDYFSYNRWGTEADYYKRAQPGVPVAGTIPRGYTGASIEGNVKALRGETVAYRPNDFVPYYYGDSEEERLRAIEEIVDNPYPITDAGLERGKELYDIYCGICHGKKGDGAGFLVREDGGKYPVQPANFLLADFVEASNGRYYHTIMYGRNMMGSYTDKLGYEERWQVIHYIRSLQAKERKLDYNQLVNTLNEVDRPAGEGYSMATNVEDKGHHDTDEENGQDGGDTHQADHH